MENTCDAYCFKVLKPMLEHIGTMQKFWEHCDAGNLSTTATRLNKIEAQLVEQAEKEVGFETAIKENKQKLSEQRTLIEKHRTALRKPFQKIGSKFYYIEEILKLNWFAAAHKCREYGADLISLSNQKELDALRPKLNSLYSYWIDLNDLSNEGEFLSITTGLRGAFKSWNTGEPNNAGSIEHCVHLTGPNSLMNDFKCSSPEYFICESVVE